MSLGDLLVLVLFVVFVILPSITRSQQQRRGGAPGAPPARPRSGAPQRTPAAGGDPASTAGAGGPREPAAFPPLDDDDLARRLAEARARVQRAMEARGEAPVPVAPAQDPRARAAAPLVSSAPKTLSGGPAGGDARARARGPLVSGGARTLSGRTVGSSSAPGDRAPTPFLGREGRGSTPSARTRRADGNDEAPAARDLRAEAPQLEVERLAGGASARPVGRGPLRLDPDTIFSGIVWHQVLGAPRARRRVGGGPFPER